MTKPDAIVGQSRPHLALGFGLLCVLASAWGAFGAPPVALAPLIWLGALWLPGAALSLGPRRPGDRTGRSSDDLWIPFVTGPVLFGAGICLGRLAGIGLGAAALITIALGFAALVIRLRPWAAATAGASGPDLPAAAADRSQRKPGTPPWHRFLPFAVGLGILLLGILPPLLHAPIRLRDDALLHLPTAQRILTGSFPPENPFLAGAPFAYFWFYHVVIAGVARLAPIPLDLIPVFLNLQALAALLLGLDRLGRRLGLSPAARAAGLAFLGLGFSPWGWMRLVTVHLTRPDISWALVKAYGVSGILPLLCPEDPRLAASLTKAYMTNALPLSLALFVLAATPPRDPQGAAWLRRGVAVAGCLLFHLATGILLAAGLATAWVLARLLPAGARKPHPDGAPLQRPPGGSLGAALALALGALATLPYVLTVMGARTGGGAATLTWQPGHALGLYLALAAVVLLALPALPSWLRRPESRAWLAVGLPALALPFAVHLVDGNEYKSLFVLLVLLSPVAGAGLARLARQRVWIMALVLAPFVPTPWLAARAYMAETPPGYLSAADRGLAATIGAALPPEAATWRVDPGEGYSAYTLPLGRPSYVSDSYALRILGQWNSEEARWRRGSLELAVQGRLGEALAAAQSRLPGRPLYPLVTRNDAMRFGRLTSGLERLGYRVEAQHPRFTLYAPPPARSPSRP